jgi:hypothetical protein
LATHNDTYVLGRNLLHEGSARRRDLYRTRHSIQKRQNTMLPAGYETRNPSKRVDGNHVLQQVHWNRQEQGGEGDKKLLEDSV